MRDTLIIGAACLAAIAVGAWLYFASPEAPEVPALLTPTTGPVAFSVAQEGQDAGNVTGRKNYRIKSSEELDELWRMMFGTAGPAVEPIDFTRQELLAIFDGTHSSGGYDVEVVSVEDTATARVVTIARTSPGENCITTDAITSPYVFVILPRSALPIQRVEQEITTECN